MTKTKKQPLLIKRTWTGVGADLLDPQNLLYLPYISCKSDKTILHDRALIFSGEDAFMLKGCSEPLPDLAQSHHSKNPFSKIATNKFKFGSPLLNFGHVYLAKERLNDQIEIIYSAPLFVRFKTVTLDKKPVYGFDIPTTLNLDEELKRHHANAVVWLPEVTLKY